MKTNWPKWVPHGTVKMLEDHHLMIYVSDIFPKECINEAILKLRIAYIEVEKGNLPQDLKPGAKARIWNKAMDMLGYTEIYDA